MWIPACFAVTLCCGLALHGCGDQLQPAPTPIPTPAPAPPGFWEPVPTTTVNVLIDTGLFDANVGAMQLNITLGWQSCFAPAWGRGTWLVRCRQQSGSPALLAWKPPNASVDVLDDFLWRFEAQEVDNAGVLWRTLDDGLLRTDLATAETTKVAMEFEGEAVIPSTSGSFAVTSEAVYFVAKDTLHRVYRFNKDTKAVTIVLSGTELNTDFGSIVLNLEATKAYTLQRPISKNWKIVSHDVDSNGMFVNSAEFATPPVAYPRFVRIAVDAMGNVWAAFPVSPPQNWVVHVYLPSGEQAAEIVDNSGKAEADAGIAFGGVDGKEVIFAKTSGLWMVRTKQVVASVLDGEITMSV